MGREEIARPDQPRIEVPQRQLLVDEGRGLGEPYNALLRGVPAVARRAPDADAELPALYAHVHPGLESIAADEIMRDLQGEIKRTERGLVVFRLRSIDADVLKLRTTEDIYLLAWGTGSLTYKANEPGRSRSGRRRNPTGRSFSASTTASGRR